MILHGTDFGSVWQASGATNFFGNGWWYHRWLWPFGLSFKGTTFVAKTTTLEPRKGNMPLKRNGVSPRELIPKCIHVNRKTGAALNAVGLSGPGLQFLINRGLWQERRDPFFISLMSLASTPKERLEEIKGCTEILRREKKFFRGAFGIQANFSCPNGGLNPQELIDEVIPTVEHLSLLNVPIVPKLGPDTSVKAAVEIAKHEMVSALCVFNTLKWDDMSDNEKIRYFGTTISPLTKYFGPDVKGGASGAPLLERTIRWIIDARRAGLQKPINAGGGIRCLNDAKRVVDAGADSIFLGSIAFLAPTQLQKTIRLSNAYIQNVLSKEGVLLWKDCYPESV